MTPQAIRNLRERLNWTQTEFGNFFDVGQVSVSKWELGYSEPDQYRMAALEQLRDRLDQAEAQEQREQFEQALKAIAVGAGIGVLLSFLFGEKD